jgi:hypothetical protein
MACWRLQLSRTAEEGYSMKHRARTRQRRQRRTGLVSKTRRRVPIPPPVTDPVESAKAAGLRYVSDDMPGIRRVRAGKGFRYFDSAGKPVRPADELRRIRSLVIPPAWT